MLSKSPANRAAWLVGTKAYPLQVKTAPYTQPGEDEMVVKVSAIAFNPVDWMKQTMGDLAFPWIKYPAIMGHDIAGEVVEVGRGASGHFRTGDRVVAMAVGTDKRSCKSAEAAFQQYVVVRSHMASQIPDFVSYEEACVLPLALGTAACGLYMKDQLALPHPTVDPKPTGEVLLVWGGSTSVGSNAIQLAIASGYEVITTASPKNHAFVKRLGASAVFDYKSNTIVKDIIGAVGSRTLAGAIAIGDGSTNPCIEIVAGCKGRKFVSQASMSGVGVPSTLLQMIGTLFTMNWAKLSTWTKAKMHGVDYKFIWGGDLMENEVSKAIYENFLPQALAKKQFVCAPEPQVIGHGLEMVQKALDIQKKGVSAKKIVITL